VFLLSLFPVRISFRSLPRLLVAVLFLFLPLAVTPRSLQETQPPETPSSATPQTNVPPSGEATAGPLAGAPAAAPAPVPSGPVVVINPAHGGTDTGARGQEGTIEKDVVLQLARALRGELERQGFHAVLTRNDDSNPSYDDRDAAANAYRDTLFISLHVSSTGTFGLVRTYYNQMASTAASAPAGDSSIPRVYSGGLVLWNEAQRPYLGASHRLATLIQVQCVQSFAGSPIDPEEVPIRELRSVQAPAVAVELSSVSGGDAGALVAKAAPLAAAIARGVQAFRADSGK
jgi:N-acetylmuramoyl-L-alanine amidase